MKKYLGGKEGDYLKPAAQCRGPRAFWGPALFGAPRFLGPRALTLFYFPPNFLFPVSARGRNNAPVRGPKEPNSPENARAQNLKSEAPKSGAQNDFFPVSARGHKEPKVAKKRQPQNLIPKEQGSKRFFCSLF